jgi:anti-sigma B factor antagonist
MFPAALDRMLPMNSEPLIVEQDEQGILHLRGPLTMENLASFQSALRRGNAPILFLDLSEVPYMDSAGLGSLVSAHVSVQKSGRRVVLTGVNERIVKLFEITRVESLFLTFPSLPDAFDALLKSGRA